MWLAQRPSTTTTFCKPSSCSRKLKARAKLRLLANGDSWQQHTRSTLCHASRQALAGHHHLEAPRGGYPATSVVQGPAPPSHVAASEEEAVAAVAVPLRCTLQTLPRCCTAAQRAQLALACLI